MQIGFESSYRRDFLIATQTTCRFDIYAKSKKSIGFNDLRNEYPFSMFMNMNLGDRSYSNWPS